MKLIKFKSDSAESIVSALLLGLVGAKSNTKNPEDVFVAFEKAREIYQSIGWAKGPGGQSIDGRKKLPYPKFAVQILGDARIPSIFYYISNNKLAKEFKRDLTELFAEGFANEHGANISLNPKPVLQLLTRNITEADISKYVVKGAETSDASGKVIELERKKEQLSQKYEELFDAKNKLEAQISNLKKENAKAISGLKDSFQNKEKDYKEKIGKLENKVKELQEKIEELQANIKELSKNK